MPIPIYDAADYAMALQEHLPRGRAWPRDPEAVQTQIIGGLSPTYARNHERAAYLITDAFPATTLELLPEWEATLGLPDPCAGEAPTLQQRIAQVVARFAKDGGQSNAFFISYAAALGYTITITEFEPFVADRGYADGPLWDEWGACTWQINAPLYSVVYFSAEVSAAEEPLAAFGNTVLECEMNAIKPAHTFLQFAYS